MTHGCSQSRVRGGNADCRLASGQSAAAAKAAPQPTVTASALICATARKNFSPSSWRSGIERYGEDLSIGLTDFKGLSWFNGAQLRKSV